MLGSVKVNVMVKSRGNLGKNVIILIGFKVGRWEDFFCWKLY